jgi:hypothetical protein
MSLQALASNLLAAGTALDEETDVQYLLFVDPKESTLNCQEWKGESLDQDRTVDSVRPNSTAAVLITATDKLVIGIKPSSKLCAYTFDDDEGDWVESMDSPVANYSVHPNGKLTATKDATGRNFVFFQDPFKQLISLSDATWKSTTIPVSAIAGTPISVLVTEDELNLYYISANDNNLHVVVRGLDDATWNDSVVIKYEFVEEIKALCMGDGESFVLTGGNELLKVSAEGKKLKLGKVEDGKFIAESTEQASITTTWYKNGQIVKQRVTRGARVRHTTYY